MLAQQPATRSEEISSSFTIEAIDHTTRVVTLRTKAGLLEEVYCGPEVQRFDALRVGDVVTFRYFETVVTALSRPGAAATPSTTVTRTPGAAPGGTIARQTTATVTLEAIDPAPPTPSVTVRTASGGRSTLRVQDAKNLEGYKVGDQVTITYTRGLAVSVAAPVPAEPKPRMEIYGFAMLDMGLNFKTINPNWFDTMRVNRLPSFDGEFGEDGSTFAGVRQTRLGVRGFNPTPLGELRTTFEFEMFGTGVDEGQTTFRLRHAYGELGQVGAGQYLEPVHGHRRVPELARVLGAHRHGVLPQRPGAVDADPGRHATDDRARASGRVGRRRPAGGPNRAGGRRAAGRRCPISPPSTASAAGRGYVEAAGLLGRMEWDDLLDDPFDLSGSATRWGLNFSSNVKLGTKATVRAQLVYGEGIQNYMNDAPVDVGIVRGPQHGDANRGRGDSAARQRPLPRPQLERAVVSSSMGYSHTDIDNTEGQADDAYRFGQYALGNLLYMPTRNVMMGAELQWGKREMFRDPYDGEGFKLQVSFRYNFSAMIGGQ